MKGFVSTGPGRKEARVEARLTKCFTAIINKFVYHNQKIKQLVPWENDNKQTQTGSLCLVQFLKTKESLGFVYKNWLPNNSNFGDFPGNPVVKTLLYNAGDAGAIPGWGAKIPHALGPKNQNIKYRSNSVTNSIKPLKMVHIKNLKKKKSNFVTNFP